VAHRARAAQSQAAQDIDSFQLTDPARYQGCELQFQVSDNIGVAPRTRSAIIAFPSLFLHRVTPIVSGVRKALVIWATGPAFR
jgi:PKHD-type hydroxylase